MKVREYRAHRLKRRHPCGRRHLWRLAQEKAGATLSSEAFRGWRKRQTHTLDNAATALGVSRRMVAYYDRGEKPIPRTVALATRALEMGG